MTDLMARSLQRVVASEKVRALTWPLDQYADQAKALLADHPDLEPEIRAANEHVALACEALVRAMGFLTAQQETENAA